MVEAKCAIKQAIQVFTFSSSRAVGSLNTKDTKNWAWISHRLSFIFISQNFGNSGSFILPCPVTVVVMLGWVASKRVFSTDSNFFFFFCSTIGHMGS